MEKSLRLIQIRTVKIIDNMFDLPLEIQHLYKTDKNALAARELVWAEWCEDQIKKRHKLTFAELDELHNKYPDKKEYEFKQNELLMDRKFTQQETDALKILFAMFKSLVSHGKMPDEQDFNKVWQFYLGNTKR